MAQRDQGTPWIQSNLGASIVAAVVGLVLSFVVNAIFDGMVWWLRLIVIAGAVVVGLIVMSLVSRKWRARSWTAFGTWLRGLGVITNRKRAAIRQEGHDAHAAEVADQRARTVQPAWKFDARDGFGQRNMYWFNNHGGGATHVRLTADPEFFVPDGEIYWASFSDAGPGRGSFGEQFKGVVTDRGRAEGVKFHVTYVDSAGDPQERDVLFPSQEFRAGRDEELEEQWARGRAEGRAEAFAERDSMPAVPLPRPRWAVLLPEGRVDVDREGAVEPFVLVNRVERSVAREVRLDAHADYFRATSAAHWEDLSGESRGEFTGIRYSDGQDYGITFHISWYDERGQQKSDVFEFPATPHPNYGGF